MQQVFQPPFVQPLMRLAQANMSLFAATYMSGSGTAAPASPMAANSMELHSHFLQGMAKNYVEFLTEINSSTLSMYAGSRASLATLAQEL
jgi:hypothetical protein